MVSKNKIIIYFLFIFILILFFVIVNNKLYNKLYQNEYFDNNTNYIQSGAGILNSSGTITFQQPFSNVPSVFIQANNGSTSSVIINTTNITNTGFSYIKNVINETITGSFSTLVMEEDSIDTFNWVAIDTTNMNNKINNPGSSAGGGCCNVCNNNNNNNIQPSS